MNRTLISLVLGMLFVGILTAASCAAADDDRELDRLASFDLQETSVSNFFSLIAEQTSLNVVSLDPVDFKVSLQTRNTPIRKSLEQVLGAHDLAYAVKGNVLEVFRKERGSSFAGRSVSYTGRLVSLDLQDTSGENARLIFEEISNSKLILPKEEGCKITFRLIDVPWGQAFEIAAAICSRQ